MRKIISKSEANKKKRLNKILLSLGMIFIMFSSILGYAFQSFGGGEEESEVEKEITTFNGFDFTQQSGFWVLDFNGLNLIFRYNPSQVIKSDSLINLLLNYEAKPLYIYSENVQAKSEIKTNLFGFVDSIENACLEGLCDDSQIKTCEDNFIIIKESEENILRQQDNCLFIEGKSEDLIKLTDGFLYKILGVA